MAYMEVLAIELAPYNIPVNMIVPGPFLHPMTKVFLGVRREKLLKKMFS
jgi:NAD(P)-dependent dehydrogenase (short-subunit alcohol dehydrogenase family)